MKNTIENWGDILRSFIAPESIQFFRNLARRIENHGKVIPEKNHSPLPFNRFGLDESTAKVELYDVNVPEITITKMLPEGIQFDAAGIMYRDNCYAFVLEQFSRNSGGFLVAKRRVVFTNLPEAGIFDSREDYNPYLSDRGDLPTGDYTGQLIEYFYRPDGSFKTEKAIVRYASDGERYLREATSNEISDIMRSSPPDESLTHRDFYIGFA